MRARASLLGVAAVMGAAIYAGLVHGRQLLGHYSSPLHGAVHSSVATATAYNAAGIIELESWLAMLNWEKTELQRGVQNIPGMSSWQEREEGDDLNSKLISKDKQILTVEEQLLALRLTDGRLINDPTLPWNATMYRPWLDPDLSVEEQPPAMILLTTLLTTKGWNQPNVSQGMSFPRHRYETALYSALVNHPWFHPTAFADIESGNLQIRTRGDRYYVFPDVHVKDFPNWPVYGGQAVNFDSSFDQRVEGGSLIGE